MDNPQDPQAARRARITYACEACRAAKVKCQPSNHSGICRRCSDSKRECIFKTGPRTRRPRQPRQTPSTTPTPRPQPVQSGPSKTFTIDIPMPDDDPDLASNLESLRFGHEMFISDFCDGAESEYESYSDDGEAHRGSVAGASSTSHTSSLPMGASALSTPPSSVSAGKTRKTRGPLASLGVRPQFNLDSAEKLLAEFEGRMVLHFPAVAPSLAFPDEAVLQDEGGERREEGFTVSRLAKTRPFVLLAILAAASGSRTLQGHSLYDDEFRKVLGLKFVAGGERSLELLQGLVVYTAWYPFHLRPKNKQAFQYVRMVTDMVNDLELDQDQDGVDDLPSEKVSEERLEQMRTYLATYHLVSGFAAAWNRSPALSHTKYTAKCCAILERDSTVKGDRILAWLVRLTHIAEEVSELRKSHRAGNNQNEYQINLMLKGMESQLAEWESRMSPEIASTTSIRLGLLFTKIFIPAAPLLKLPMARTKRPTNQTLPGDSSGVPFMPDPARLAGLVPDLHRLFDWVLTLSAQELNSFSGPEWGRFILTVILAFRLSFPLLDCPGWDDGRARAEIGFGEYLRRFVEELGGSSRQEEGGDGVGESGAGGMDVLTAGKVVLGVVRGKWEKRVARIERGKKIAVAAQQQGPGEQQMGLDLGVGGGGMDAAALSDKSMHGCPMMDGSLDAYYPLWDESFSSAGMAGMAGMVGEQSGAGVGGGPPLPGSEYVDIWGNMTAGWAQWPQAAQGDGGFGGSGVPWF